MISHYVQRLQSFDNIPGGDRRIPEPSTVFSIQKWVRFREVGSSSLFGIRIDQDQGRKTKPKYLEDLVRCGEPQIQMKFTKLVDDGVSPLLDHHSRIDILKKISRELFRFFSGGPKSLEDLGMSRESRLLIVSNSWLWANIATIFHS